METTHASCEMRIIQAIPPDLLSWEHDALSSAVMNEAGRWLMGAMTALSCAIHPRMPLGKKTELQTRLIDDVAIPEGGPCTTFEQAILRRAFLFPDASHQEAVILSVQTHEDGSGRPTYAATIIHANPEQSFDTRCRSAIRLLGPYGMESMRCYSFPHREDPDTTVFVAIMDRPNRAVDESRGDYIRL